MQCYIYHYFYEVNRQYTTTVVAENRWFPNIKELLQIGITFFSTMVAWVFFRSENITNAFDYLFKMINEIGLPFDNHGGIIFVALLIVIEWFMRKDEKSNQYQK